MKSLMLLLSISNRVQVPGMHVQKLLEGRYYTGVGTNYGRTYEVSPDGQRFLMLKAPGIDASAAPPALIVVQHWNEELKRLVPTTR